MAARHVTCTLCTIELRVVFPRMTLIQRFKFYMLHASSLWPRLFWVLPNTIPMVFYRKWESKKWRVLLESWQRKTKNNLSCMVTLMLKRKRLKHMGRRQARRNLQRRNARGHWILAVQKTIWSRLNCFSTSLSFKPGLFSCKQTFCFLFHTMFAIMVQFIHETVLWTTMHVFYDQSYSCFWVVFEMALCLKKFPSIKLGTQSHRNRVSRERRASHGSASHASLFWGRNHNIVRIDKVHGRTNNMI